MDLDSDTARLISKSKRIGISSCSPKMGKVGWGENWEREIWEEMSGTRETVKSGLESVEMYYSNGYRKEQSIIKSAELISINGITHRTKVCQPCDADLPGKGP